MIVVNFSKNFYNPKAVKSAIRAYGRLADFNLSETKEKIRVSIKNIKKEVRALIKDEFCNYVLAQTKHGR